MRERHILSESGLRRESRDESAHGDCEIPRPISGARPVGTTCCDHSGEIGRKQQFCGASGFSGMGTLHWNADAGSRLRCSPALVRAAFADQGVKVEIEFYPWARALHLARTGEVDGLMPEYFDASRETEFQYSAALHALKAKRLGVVRGYLNTPVFDAATKLG